MTSAISTVPRPAARWLSLLVLLAGSLLIGFSMGRWLAPLAAWIGPALLIRYARDHRAGRGYLLVLAALVLAFVIGFGEIWASMGGPQNIPVFAVMYGLLWSLPYLADRLVSPRLPGFSATLVYPLAATTLEFLNIHTNPMGTWGATGFSQYGELPLMQLASVTGMIGITFLMGWFASVANWAWENRARGTETRSGLAVFGVVLAVVMGFGFVRLSSPPAGETIRVAGITAESLRPLMHRWASDMQDPATASLAVQPVRDAYFDETEREAKAGARVVVWPEVAGIGQATDEASLIDRAKDVARQYGIYLTVPLYTHSSDPGQPLVNRLLLVDPAGTVVLEHVKYGGNFFEGSLRGDGTLRTVATPFGVLSGAICWDMDFPGVIKQAGQNGTGLMLVPASDWIEIHPIHSQMAVFRAIENGMSMVRQVDSNVSMAVDPYGRVLAQTDFFGATDRTLVAQVPTEHVATLYTAGGHWFEWVCVVGFVLVVVYAVARTMRARGRRKVDG